MSMACQTYLSLIGEPWRYLVLCMSVIFGIIASLGNIIALLILCKSSMRSSKSNRIIISLVTSDLLVGCAFLPVLTYQMSDESHLTDCTIENIRIAIGTSTIGTSSMNVALIAIDRYFLTTNYVNYIQKRSSTRIIILLNLIWIFPFFAIACKFINGYMYLALSSSFIFGPIVAQIIFYILLVGVLKKNAKRLEAYKQKSTGQVDIKMKVGNDKTKKSSKNTRLVKTTILLTTCFIICMLPVLIALITTGFYQGNTPLFLNDIFIVGLLSAAVNSCINPFIYASRFPKFRFHLKILLRVKTSNESMSSSTRPQSSSTK